MQQPVFRFAPSPNGLLHAGHAYSALVNERLCRAAEGRLLLRIEDIDLARAQPEFERAIVEDLAWLGIRTEPEYRRQSEHYPDYEAALTILRDEGLVYPAFMSRGEFRRRVADMEADGISWPRDPDGAPHYPPDDRELSPGERRRRIEAGEPFAWRLDMEAAMRLHRDTPQWHESGAGPQGETGLCRVDPRIWGDVILARKDVPASYHLAVVVDDALQGVTQVVRGRDLFYATAIHRLLQDLLGLPAPLYHHHRLILGADGRKLSKSRGDPSLAALRAAGLTRMDLERMLDAAQDGI